MRQSTTPIVCAILAAGFIIASSICFATAMPPRVVALPAGGSYTNYGASIWLWVIAWSCGGAGLVFAGLALLWRPRDA
jgi:hypothetical protein